MLIQDRLRRAFQVAVLTPLLAISLNNASAQVCDSTYVLLPGDTLFGLAEQIYDDENKWPIIFYTNQDVLGSSPSLIRPGIKVFLPCLSTDRRPRRHAQGEPSQRVSATEVELRLLTGDNYPPFTGRSLDRMGMFTDLIVTALEQYADSPTFGVFWVKSWATHLDPLLSTTAFDAGFPWFKPDCAYRSILQASDAGRCDFLFSTRIQSVPVKLFVRKTDPIRYESDDDILGLRLCRPKGYYTFDLDQYGRRWLIDRKIQLAQPDSPQDCFKLLLASKVDGVALAALVGQKTMAAMDIASDVREIEKELSTEGLHVLVHKSHPKADEYIRTINKAITQIKETGVFRQISTRHMTNPETVVDIWGGAN